jgi:hypothetical protein
MEGQERGGKHTDSHEMVTNQLQKNSKETTHFPVRVLFACIRMKLTLD